MNETQFLAVLAFDDVEVLDFCGPFEVFSVANRFTDPPAFTVQTVAEKAERVVTRGGLSVKPSTITNRRLFHPCLDTFLRALAFTYRNVPEQTGTVAAVTIRGEAGDDWYRVKEADAWRPVAQPTASPKATVALCQGYAWKLFTKRMDRQSALDRFKDIAFEGDRDLWLHVLDTVSVMA